MKKKFSSLFMAATLVFAVGALFSSCRDHDEELSAEIHAQAQVLEELNQELSDAINDLKGEVDNALPEVNADIEGLENKIDALQHVIDSLAGIDHDHADFATKQELADSVAALNEAIKALADKMATKEALQEVADSLANLKSDYATHIEAFNALSATVTDAVGRLTTLEGNYATLDASVKSILADIATIKGDLATVMTQAAEADARSKKNESSIAVIEGRLDDLKTYVDDLVAAKATELTAALQEAVEGLRAEYTQALKDSVAVLRAEAAANLAEAKAYADEAAAAVAAELAETNATVAALQDAFKSAVAELQDQIDVLQEEVDEVAYQLEEVEERLGLVEEKVDQLEEEIQNRISNIVLNGAYSPVVGYFSLPTGVKSNILAAYYGEANDFHFPTTRTVYNVAGSGVFTDADFEILGIQETAQEGGVTVAEGANAGKLYVTFNPAEVSLEGKEFAFVNSLGEESPVKILGVKESEDKLTFGYTRAGAPVALYEAEAALAAEDVEAAKLRIELSDLKDLIKDAASISDGFNVSDMATTLYAVVNDIADAQALKATWADADGQTHTVYSDFGLAAVAVKPLGYNFLADFEISSFPGYHKAMNIVNQIFDEVGTVTLPDLGLSDLTATLEKISLGNIIGDEIEFDIEASVEIEGVKYPVTDKVRVPSSKVFGDMDASLENLDKFLSQVNDILVSVNGKVENTINSVAGKVQKELNKYLDKINNKLCSMVNSFNAVLQPTMLVSTVDGFSMLSSIKAAPTTIDKASAVLVPTSFSGEFLAPAYKKYVAVTKAYDAEGNADDAAAKAANTGELNTVLEGTVREVAFDGKSGYTYEITYSAVDFYGMISTTKYYVKVK